MSKRLQLNLPFKDNLKNHLAKEYPEVKDFRILSKSLDARNANRGRNPKYQYVLETIEEDEKFSDTKESFESIGKFSQKPIIIGAGPAGLFCALRLAEYGVKSLIFERGDEAHKRMIHIGKYWRRGEFNTENNVCYGEGGAGLFSDGKLITRIKSPFVQYVMNKFVEFGAPVETAYLANPHLGSNKIRQLIGKMTQSLKERGTNVYYNSRVERLIEKDGQIVGVELSSGEQHFSEQVILATGHSATEVYRHLKDLNVSMTAKDFAVGVRVEHPRHMIDHIQYGSFSDDESLGASRYRLSWEDKKTKKGTYSFCMCPGGYVLSSGTNSDGIVVNGMSNYSRRGHWSNSALVVSVKSGEDFSVDDVLGGLNFQHNIERKAFEASSSFASGKEVPAETLKNFMDGHDKKEQLNLKTSCPSGIVSTPMRSLFPEFVTKHLYGALKVFNQRMNGFISDQALFLAPETRTSAPVTIKRNKETLISESHPGLYPCGEGAGYAGGITSAAVDGVKIAEEIIKNNR